MQSQATAGNSGLMGRIMGVVTLKAPVYREIADDTSATMQAAIIVVVVSVVVGIIGAILVGAIGAAAGVAVSPISSLIRSVLTAIIDWLIAGWVFAFVAKTFFQGKTNTGEMLRVFGFTQIFALLGIIPVIGTIVGLVLSVIGAIIGIREAAEFDTTKAILTGVIGLVVLVVIGIILGIIFAAVGLV